MDQILGHRRDTTENQILPYRREAPVPHGPGVTDVDPLVRRVFGPFQNLNLLVLLEDLRAGRVVWGDWAFGGWLCPVAHGLPRG